jgi:two-component system, response regulator
MKKDQKIRILIADDDPDDKILIREAFQENFLNTDIVFVENGEELMRYLGDAGKFEPGIDAGSGLPDLILLDLNMPRKDGREALREIKAHPVLRTIPVVIFSTSRSEIDLVKSYELGANSFITKPVTYMELLEVTKAIGKYWFDTVMLFPKEHYAHELKAR